MKNKTLSNSAYQFLRYPSSLALISIPILLISYRECDKESLFIKEFRKRMLYVNQFNIKENFKKL